MILVNVRWWDGYLEAFECSQVRQGAYILWMRLENGQNRTIPLIHVRWFSTNPESHAITRETENKPSQNDWDTMFHCLEQYREFLEDEMPEATTDIALISETLAILPNTIDEAFSV